MSGTILAIRPRQREPLPPFGPAERVINGRIYYSAAWLGAAPFEPEPAVADDKPKEEKMDVTVRFTLEGRGDEANTAEWIARLVAQLLCEEGLVVGERGVGRSCLTLADGPRRRARGGMKDTEDDGLPGAGGPARAPASAAGALGSTAYEGAAACRCPSGWSERGKPRLARVV